MTKKNQTDIDSILESEIEETPIQEVANVPIIIPEHFSRVLWKETLEVFKCETCGDNRNDIDEIRLHVLTHYPEDEREAMLEVLLQEN
jgi:hypothetical protein